MKAGETIKNVMWADCQLGPYHSTCNLTIQDAQDRNATIDAIIGKKMDIITGAGAHWIQLKKLDDKGELKYFTCKVVDRKPTEPGKYLDLACV